MIVSEQIRAGRALLGWSQKTLAGAARLSLNALNHLEKGTGNPRHETLQSIQKALEDQGIEFLDGQGVRKRGESFQIETIDGPDILENFYNDFLHQLPRGGEVLYNGIDNTHFHHRDRYKLAAFKEMEMELRARGGSERLIFLEGDVNFLSSVNCYRWVPRELFGEIPYAVYGDNVGIILWGPPQKLVIIRNHSIAQTFRAQFELIWSVSRPVPDSIYEFHRAKDHEWKNGEPAHDHSPPEYSSGKNRRAA